jgi:hypothetical protein
MTSRGNALRAIPTRAFAVSPVIIAAQRFALHNDIKRGTEMEDLRRRTEQARIQAANPGIAIVLAQMSELYPDLPASVLTGAAVGGIPVDHPALASLNERVSLSRTLDPIRTQSNNILSVPFQFLRGGIRLVTTAFDALYEEAAPRLTRTGVGISQGMDFAEAHSAAGSSTGVRAVGTFFGGESPFSKEGFESAIQNLTPLESDPNAQVNLGGGFLPQSNLADAESVEVQMLVGLGIPEPNAIAQVQQKFGDPLSQMARAQAHTGITFDDGTPISPGRLAAKGFGLEVGTMPFHIVSGAADFASQLWLDPTNAALFGLGKLRKANKALIGGTRRSTFGVGVDEFVQSPSYRGMTEKLALLSQNTSAAQDIKNALKLRQFGSAPKGLESRRLLYELVTEGQRHGAAGIDATLRGLPSPGLRQGIPAPPRRSYLDTGMFESVPTPRNILSGVRGPESRTVGQFLGSQFRDPEAALVGEAFGLKAAIRHASEGTWAGRMVARMPRGSLDLEDLDRGLDKFEDWMTSAAFTADESGPFLLRWARLADGDSAGAYAVYRDARRHFVMNKLGDEIPEHIRETLLRVYPKEWDDFRSYWANSVGQAQWFPDTELKMIVDDQTVAIARPTAHQVNELLQKELPLDDPRELRRALGRVNGSWVSKASSDSELNARAWLNVVDGYMSKVWRPFVLLRIAWPVRIGMEEQVRLAFSGMDSMFTHPFSWFAYAFGNKMNRTLVDELLPKDVGPLPARLGGTGRSTVGQLRQGQFNEYGEALMVDSGWWLDFGGKAPGHKKYTNVFRDDPNDAGRVVDAWMWNLGKLHSNPVGRFLRRNGVDDTIEWMMNGGGKGYLRQMVESGNPRRQAFLGSKLDDVRPENLRWHLESEFARMVHGTGGDYIWWDPHTKLWHNSSNQVVNPRDFGLPAGPPPELRAPPGRPRPDGSQGPSPSDGLPEPQPPGVKPPDNMQKRPSPPSSQLTSNDPGATTAKALDLDVERRAVGTDALVTRTDFEGGHRPAPDEFGRTDIQPKFDEPYLTHNTKTNEVTGYEIRTLKENGKIATSSFTADIADPEIMARAAENSREFGIAKNQLRDEKIAIRKGEGPAAGEARSAKEVAERKATIDRFEALQRRVFSSEKVSNPADWTPAERAAFDAGEYEEFSRLRGYTEDEIAEWAEYQSFLEGTDAELVQLPDGSVSGEALFEQGRLPGPVTEPIQLSIGVDPRRQKDFAVMGYDDSITGFDSDTMFTRLINYLDESPDAQTVIDDVGQDFNTIGGIIDDLYRMFGRADGTVDPDALADAFREFNRVRPLTDDAILADAEWMIWMINSRHQQQLDLVNYVRMKSQPRVALEGTTRFIPEDLDPERIDELRFLYRFLDTAAVNQTGWGRNAEDLVDLILDGYPNEFRSITADHPLVAALRSVGGDQMNRAVVRSVDDLVDDLGGTTSAQRLGGTGDEFFHGTDAPFEVFDTTAEGTKSRSGGTGAAQVPEQGRKFYFTDDEDVARAVYSRQGNPGSRVIKTKIYGETVNFRAESLDATLAANPGLSEALLADDILLGPRGNRRLSDFRQLDRSFENTAAWMRERGIGKALIDDTTETGGQSVIGLEEFIDFGRQAEGQPTLVRGFVDDTADGPRQLAAAETRGGAEAYVTLEPGSFVTVDLTALTDDLDLEGVRRLRAAMDEAFSRSNLDVLDAEILEQESILFLVDELAKLAGHTQFVGKQVVVKGNVGADRFGLLGNDLRALIEGTRGVWTLEGAAPRIIAGSVDGRWTSSELLELISSFDEVLSPDGLDALKQTLLRLGGVSPEQATGDFLRQLGRDISQTVPPGAPPRPKFHPISKETATTDALLDEAFDGAYQMWTRNIRANEISRQLQPGSEAVRTGTERRLQEIIEELKFRGELSDAREPGRFDATLVDAVHRLAEKQEIPLEEAGRALEFVADMGTELIGSDRIFRASQKFDESLERMIVDTPRDALGAIDARGVALPKVPDSPHVPVTGPPRQAALPESASVPPPPAAGRQLRPGDPEFESSHYVITSQPDDEMWDAMDTGVGRLADDDEIQLFPEGNPMSHSEDIDQVATSKQFLSDRVDKAPPVLPYPDPNLSADDRGVWDKMLNTVFYTLGGGVTNKLARAPAWRQFYLKRVQHLKTFVDEDTARQVDNMLLGDLKFKKSDLRRKAPVPEGWVDRAPNTKAASLSIQEIDQIAKGYALEETKRLLYDVTTKHNASDALRNVFPFAEAWAEIITVWSRIMFENPRVFRRAQQGVEAARESGFFYTDANGEEVFAYPGSEFITRALLGTGEDTEVKFTGSVAGINLALGQYIPGFGPVAQVPVSMLVPNMPQFDTIRNLVTPFGEEGIRTPGDLLDLGLPAWFEKLMVAIGTGSSEYQRLHHNTVMDVFRILAAENPEKMNSSAAAWDLMEEASQKASFLSFVRAGAGFILPTGPSIEYDVRDTDGKVWQTQALISEYYRLLRAADFDQEIALTEFIQRFGFGQNYLDGLGVATLFTTPKTISVQERSVTETGHGWRRTNGDLFEADAFPNTAAYGMQDLEWDDFNYEAYKDSLATGARAALTPEQWLQRRNELLGNLAYDKAKEAVVGRTDRKARLWLRDVRLNLASEYTGFDADIAGIPRRADTETLVRELERWAAEPRLGGSNAGQGLAVYLELRKMAENEAFRRGLMPDSWQSATSMRVWRDWLREASEAIMAVYPEFGQLWFDVFRRELNRDETPDPLTLEGMTF